MKALYFSRKAASAVAFALIGSLPMFVLGWLVAALVRHPVADNELRTEPVYRFLVWWQGGIAAFPYIFIFALLLVAIMLVGLGLRRSGYGESGDGMEIGRIFVCKFLLPAILTTGAFICGVLSDSSLLTSSKSFIWFGLVVIFSVVVHCVVDLTGE